jgi:hypothetical protein
MIIGKKPALEEYQEKILSNFFYSPHIVLAVDKTASKCLILLLVYNACGCERVEILKILDGHNNY